MRHSPCFQREWAWVAFAERYWSLDEIIGRAIELENDPGLARPYALNATGSELDVRIAPRARKTNVNEGFCPSRARLRA